MVRVTNVSFRDGQRRAKQGSVSQHPLDEDEEILAEGALMLIFDVASSSF